MHNHNNSDNNGHEHKGMMWMMLVCCLVLIVTLLVGTSFFTSIGYGWVGIVLIGGFAAFHLRHMFGMHDKHKQGSNVKNDPNSKNHKNCCHWCMQNEIIKKSIVWGLISTAALLAVYFIVVSLISNTDFAISQLSQYWYFIIRLALGFGIQVSLYTYLKQSIKNESVSSSGKTVVVTGTTSTLSMISCSSYFRNHWHNKRCCSIPKRAIWSGATL